MRESLRTKISLISQGMRFDYEMFRESSQQWYENTYGYCITNKGVEREDRVPQVLHLGDDVVVSVLRREGSPWSLRFEGEQLNLYHEGSFHQTVGLPEPLPFFGKQLSDGAMTDDVISAYGAQTPGFFIYPHCHYFPKGKPCQFCSLDTARKSVGRPLEARLTRQRMMETTRHIMASGWEIPMVTNTCGTPRNDELTRKFILEPLRGIKEGVKPGVNLHLLAHPPNDLSLLHEYKEAGVTSIALNIEVYDRRLFAEICPGKHELYGYDRWWEALDYARDVFGDYQVYCGIIWGIEPVESSMEAMEEILSRRIGLATNIFHADPGTPMEHHPQPSVEEITALAQREHELYERFPEAGTIYDLSMRNTIDWEVRNGYMAPAVVS